ncbi:EscU/YscU/HrcU family type III secretion system export apparatus switch protein [Guyparkeria hydrothermalis]|uniref:Flagellar biosynthetic protein FlhB n=1 Tax=Guyparkeria halophila TaxID=47960 RepID=A0A6I6CXZ4_9GAMM|nr:MULTISPECIES: EscU/YscU/HrcU family type III secretion system export apparatus switch protein [Guyparkeria]MCL7750483.1 EscU/YscU/HrcU family type III secretion system export apparatus switch protein [Guyparkeria hydrothermalis]QGT79069.1 flagellar biosynthesis protein FlhB [Guyparkeria halophila]
MTERDETRHTQSKPRRAIALAYDGTDVPQVVATGQDELARRIIEVARENDVPAVEDPMLARALAEIDLGDRIPEALFRAVAEVLSYALYVNDRHEEVLRRARERVDERDRNRDQE